MPEIQAERRIVKSPPELWAELSELESLARHLGEFGEIRITRLEPETTVAWEGDEVSGTVELEASGWGTKVRLTVATAEEARPPAGEGADVDPAGEHDARADVDPPGGDEAGTAVDDASEEPLDEIEIAGPLAAPAIEPPQQPAPVPDPATAAARAIGASVPPPGAPEPDLHPRPRQGWLARFLRRRRGTHTVAPEPVVAEVGETGGEVDGDDVPEGVADDFAEPRAGTDADGDEGGFQTDAKLAADGDGEREGNSIDEENARRPTAELPGDTGSPASSERSKRVESVLAMVLDDLGAAHHRPFSRG